MMFNRFLTVLYVLALVTLAFAEDVEELAIETVKNGDCAREAKDGDTLKMHYEGTLMDGSEFDSSYKRGDPFSVTLGAGMVIKGWEEGLLGMCKGEIRMLTIPSAKAYGDQGYPPVIPEKAALKFKVELLSFGDDGDDEL